MNKINCLNLHSDLHEVEECPVCGSKAFHLAEHSLRKNDEGWVYSSRILQLDRGKTQEVCDTIQAFKCNNCTCLFYSPWHQLENAADAFVTRINRHQQGWGNLQHVLISPKHGTVQRLNQKVLEYCKFDIPITRYAEIGCPLHGLNLLEFSNRYPSLFYRLSRFFNAAKPVKDKRNRLASRVYDTVQVLGLVLSVVQLALEGVVRKALNIRNRSSKKSFMNSADKYFLSINTPVGWGGACEGLGGTCQRISSNLLDLKVIPLYDVQQKDYFDLIGIFNFLDHLGNPMGVLEKATSVAKNIVITVHKPEYAGKQHRIIIGESFAEYLERKFEDFVVDTIDINDGELKGPDLYNVFLLSKKEQKHY